MMLIPSLSWGQVQITVIPMMGSVQVQAYNSGNKNALCQGTVRIHYQQEGLVNEYFSAYIGPQVTATQTYTSMRLNDMVYSAFHSINCFQDGH